MSGGPSCNCKGRLADRMKQWEAIDVRCNYSAFNGYRCTPSEYSSVHCKQCGRYWRTKAKYVWKLPRGKF